MSSPLISVVMVSYHTGPSLFDSIVAVLGQTVPVELLLIDNGNPTDVLERLRAIGQRDSRLKLLSGHGNIGFGRANNMGVMASSGDYLLILNPDSLLPPDSLEKLLRHTEHTPAHFLIGARLLNQDGTDQRGSRRELLTPISALIEALHLGRFFPHHRLNRHEATLPSTLTPCPAISGAFMFMSRRSYDLIHGFDESYFLHVEDLDFCWRFHAAGGTILFAPDIPVTHLGGTSRASSDFIERCKAKSFSLYFHNNFKQKTSLTLLWCLDLAIWGRYLLRRILSSGFFHAR